LPCVNGVAEAASDEARAAAERDPMRQQVGRPDVNELRACLNPLPTSVAVFDLTISLSSKV